MKTTKVNFHKFNYSNKFYLNLKFEKGANIWTIKLVQREVLALNAYIEYLCIF